MMQLFPPVLFFLLLSFSTSTYADEFKDAGKDYLQGNYESAAQSFSRLAKRGDHRAMYALGSLYAEGHGVEKNLKKSFELFSEAAQNGRADAMYKLGLMYEQGLGIKQNYKKALRYYQKSAKKGYPLGQYRFGLMYVDGKGVKPNTVNAYSWLVVAGHYFIYEVATKDVPETTDTINHKQQLLLFHHKEKDRILNNIISQLQQLRTNMTEQDVKKTRQKVIKFSQYRKKYHAISRLNPEVGPDIENLFLPETLY